MKMKKGNNLILSVLLITTFWGCAGLQKTVEKKEPPAGLSLPVTIQLPSDGMVISSQYVTLQSQRDGDIVPAQISAADQKLNTHKTFASALVPPSDLSEPLSIIQAKGVAPALQGLRWEDDEKTTLSLYEGNRLILKYHYGIIPAPEGVPVHRSRSSYFHPLLGLDGETFTQDFPPDHYHHRGFYFAWPGVFLNGQRYDMWHLIGMWTRYERTLVQEEGPVFAYLSIQNGWYTKDRKVMNEIMELKVWHSNGLGQVLDVRYTWTPLAPLHIGPKDQKGYGGLNFRFPEREGTIVTNIDGVQKTSDLKKSPWVDLSGRFEKREEMSGVTFMNHPDNIEPNPGWIIRAQDKYGFIGISWPGIGTFDFEVGKTYSNLYRLWLHRGNCEEGQSRQMYENFKHPKLLVAERKR